MKVFYSYCHKDEQYREKLETFLCTLRDRGKITEWHDRKIIAGENWSEKIQNELENADIILLLISQDFLASDACKKELDYAFDEKNHKLAIPIILKPCMWLDTKIKKIQAVPKDGKAITSWDSQEEAWLDVAQKISIAIDNFIKHPKCTFIDELNETGFINSGKDNIKLTDLFIFPEVDFVKVDGKHSDVTFSLDTFLENSNKYCIIKGEELSGKSSVLKYLYIELSKQNAYPVFIDASCIKKTRNFESILASNLREQYDNFTTSDFSLKESKIALVDDFNYSVSDNFIYWLKEHFDKIYISINNEEQMVFYKDSRCFSDFNQISIKPLSHYSRYELIKKWKEFEKDPYTTEEMFQNQIDQLENNVNSIIIDKNIVPNTPFYILTIIQSYEAFMPSDLKITSYGHCYHALIVARLINYGITNQDIDDCFNYLSYVARFLYDNREARFGVISVQNYEKCKKEYKEKFLISDSLITKLEEPECSIFKFSYDEDSHHMINFTYPFIFYFFLGRNLANSQDSNKVIEELCEKIYLKEYANILIFAIHHSTTISTLEEIELHCMVSFDSLPVSTLSTSETKFMNQLMASIPKEIQNSKNSEQRRIEIRKEQDRLEDEKEELNLPAITEDSSIEIKEIEKSLKIVEVLGQIIKTRCGSLPITKTRELMKEVEELSLRNLSFFLNTLKENDFKKWIAERIETIEKDRQLDKIDIEKIVEQNIQVMGFCIILEMLQKTYLSLASAKIKDLQEEISEQADTVAFDFIQIFFKLNYEGIKINYIEKYYKKFNEQKNFWAAGSLSILVQGYLESHNVEPRTRQQICSLFGISYMPNKYISSNSK